MTAKRISFTQIAADKIAEEIRSGPEADFFAGIPVLAGDPGDVVARANQALAETSLCIVIAVTGGPAPIPGDPTSWNAELDVLERPAVNRAAGDSAKTADQAADALLRTFAWGEKHFLPSRDPEAVAMQVEEERGTVKQVVWRIRGTTTVLLADAPACPNEAKWN
jgi:hypothetical protein